MKQYPLFILYTFYPSLSLWACFLLFLCSCLDKKERHVENSDVVAKVYDTFLYKHDLQSSIPKGMSDADSADIVKAFIDSWVKQKLLLKTAEKNIKNIPSDIERQLDDYRSSMIIYTYQKELVRQRLDTTVSIQEIDEYYNNNIKNFNPAVAGIISSPAISENEKIRAIILNNRKLKLLADIEERIFNEAQSKNDVKIY